MKARKTPLRRTFDETTRPPRNSIRLKQIPLRTRQEPRPDRTADRAPETQRHQEAEEEDDVDVDLAFHVRALDRRRGRVAHQLRFVSCEDDEPIAPRCVAKLSTAQEDLVRSQRNLLRRSVLGYKIESAFGFVNTRSYSQIIHAPSKV